MLARNSTLRHPRGGEVDLPLLVPSFSSKGFLLLESTENKPWPKNYSESAYHLEGFSRSAMQAGLISAFDLHYGHFKAPDLSPDSPTNYLQNTILMFIDSGGYELIPDFDSTEPKRHNYVPVGPFERHQCAQILTGLNSQEDPLQLVVTSYDHDTIGKPLACQIELARKFFDAVPGQLTNFLVKPWDTDSKRVTPNDLSPTDYEKFANFDIIGVTEKELGADLIDRLKAIAALRRGLTAAGLDTPIHVWGGLDPVLTPLYFFAGAEIFDGVSWLRYAYRNGISIYRYSYGVLNGELSIRASKNEIDLHVNMKNLSFLNKLSDAMMQWFRSEGSDYSEFEPGTQNYLKSAYESMKTRIPNLEG